MRDPAGRSAQHESIVVLRSRVILGQRGTADESNFLCASISPLHVAFAEPVPAVGEGQERGNSGVFLMGLYEIQVLDSYQSKTYADGQASAVYAQFPPQVNASRAPGQ